MKIFWATRDFDCNDFHIEEVNPMWREPMGLNQVWELNNNCMESEVYVKEETLEKAAAKALILFRR
jgi:hypothetical protein